jgi:spore coat protein CotH
MRRRAVICHDLMRFFSILPGVAALLLLRPAPAAAQEMDEFFDDGVVHEIRLTINSKDWSALKTNFKENIYYPCSLQWRGVTVRNVGIRSRGLGSRSGTKPGLRVDMDRYAADQTFLGLKSFVLDNLVQDPSLLRERVAMAFLRRMGLPAPREAHARLFVNNQLAGVYAIVESIDKGFLARSFGQDSEGKVENDGYLFEYKFTEDYRFEYRGSDLAEYKFFEPKTNENKADAQIWGPIEEMIQAMNQSPDGTFVRDMGDYLDLRLFAKQIALENFLAEDDGILGYAGLNNFYFYRFEHTNRSQFLAWDKDNTFHSIDFPIMKGVNENVLARRTLNVREYRDVYLETLLDAAVSADEKESSGDDGEDGNKKDNDGEDSGPGWLEREITREYEQIRTFARSDTFKPQSNTEFEDAYQQLLEFARNRSAFVRDEVSALQNRR